MDQKNRRKKYALQDSSAALEQDNAKLIEFIEDDNMKRQEKMLMIRYGMRIGPITCIKIKW